MSSPAPLKPHDVEEGMLVLVTGSNPEERGTVVKKQGMRVSVEVVTVANGETARRQQAPSQSTLGGWRWVSTSFRL